MIDVSGKKVQGGRVCSYRSLTDVTSFMHLPFLQIRYCVHRIRIELACVYLLLGHCTLNEFTTRVQQYFKASCSDELFLIVCVNGLSFELR